MRIRIALAVFSFFAVWGAAGMPGLTPAMAQDLTITTTQPTSMSTCGGEEMFSVLIENTGLQVSGIRLTVQLPQGVNYVLGSVMGASEAPAGGGDLNVNAPEFALDMDPLPANTDTMVSYRAVAGCGFLAEDPSAVNETRADYTQADGATAGCDTETSLPYDVLFPVLSLETDDIDPNPLRGDVGQMLPRDIRIENSGTATVHGFTVTDTYGPLVAIGCPISIEAASVDATILSCMNVGGTVTIEVSAELPPVENNFVTIREHIEILGCDDEENPSTDSDLTVSWGCGNETCDARMVDAEVRPPLTKPTVTITSNILTEFCFAEGNVKESEIAITNSGSPPVPAFDVSLELFRYFSTFTYPLADTFKLEVAGIEQSFPPDPDTLETINGACQPNEIRRAFFTIPRIEPFETVYLRWDTTTCCPSACGDFVFHRNDWLVRESHHKNQCSIDRTTNRLFGVRDELRQQAFLLNQAVEGKTDLFDGEQTTVTFINGQFSLWPGDASQVLRAEFTLNPGLRYPGPCGPPSFPDGTCIPNTSEFFLLTTSGVVLHPASLVIVSGLNDGTGTTVLRADFTFPPLPDSQDSGAWSPEMVKSEFKIRIEGQCTGSPEPPTLSLSVSHFPSTICVPSCEVPLACIEAGFNLHCPGCQRQGIQVTGFDFTRTTFGDADNDNDGVADHTVVDGNCVVIGPGGLDLDRIKTRRATGGDVIEGVLRGFVNANEFNQPWDFANDALPFPLDYGYFSMLIQNGSRLTPLDATLLIEANRGNGPVLANCTIPAGSVVHRLAGDVAEDPRWITVASGHAEFFYDFSIPDVLNSLPGCATYDTFHDQDQITLTSRFKVTGSVPFNAGLVATDVRTHAYLGFEPNPFCDPAGGCDPGDDDLVELCDEPVFRPECDGTVQYYCCAHSDRFSLVGYSNVLATELTHIAFGTCSKSFGLLDILSIGSASPAGSNFFPFEFRSYLEPDLTHSVTLPARFSFKSASLAGQRGAGTNQAVLERVAGFTETLIVGNTITFDLDQYLTHDPCLAGLNDEALYIGDETFRIAVGVTVVPSCEVVPDVPHPFSMDAEYTYPEIISACSLLPTMLDRDLTIEYHDPQLVVPEISKSGVSDLVCWDTTVNNVDPQGDAGNAWLAFDSQSGLVAVDSVTVNGQGVTPMDGLYRLGDIDRNQSKSVTICASYPCELNPDTPDPLDFKPEKLTVLAGWDCTGYPASVADYDPCVASTRELTVIPLEAGMQVVVDAPASAEVCGAAPYEIVVNSNADGTLFDIKVSFTVPEGLSLVDDSGMIVYPVGAGFVQQDPLPLFPGSDTYEWDIGSIVPAIGMNGLPGGADADSQFKVRVDLESDCDFSPGSAVHFEVTSMTNCGTDLMLSSDEPLDILGFPPFTNQDVMVTVAPFGSCDTTTTVDVVMTNIGALATGNDDFFRLMLPAGLSYEVGSFVAGINAPPNPVPDQMPIDSDTQLSWQLLAEVQPGHTIAFSFLIARDDTATCGPFPLVATSVFIAGVACSTGGECLLEAQTGFSSQLLNVAAPDAAFSVPTLVCVDQPVEVDGGSCGEQTWNFGDGTPAVAGSPASHTYNGAGTYVITHTVQGDCSDSSSTEEVVAEVCNQPPTCDAGGPYLVECLAGQGSIPLNASLSSDPDGDELTHLWATDCPGGMFDDPGVGAALLTVDGPGACAVSCFVELTVTDPFGESDTCQAAITVQDTTPPQLDLPSPVTLECTDASGVAGDDPRLTAWLAQGTASDDCGPVTLVHDVPATFPGACAPGFTTTVTFTATDACGLQVSGSSTVTIVDTVGPVIDVQPSLDPSGCAFLWPPQHGYVDFGVDDTGIQAYDACGGDVTYEFSSCHSSQPEEAGSPGDGHSFRDCLTEGMELHLRAERDGDCPVHIGRVYTITMDAIDQCGNRTVSDPFTMCVPHDRGPQDPPPGLQFSANPGSNQADERPGVNGTYNTDCGEGCPAECDVGSE